MSLDRYKYYRLSREEREVLVDVIRESLKKRAVKLAIIFGSFVELDSFRDVDVAVYVEQAKLDLNSLLRLSTELEEKIRIPVDVVPLEDMPTKLRYHVLTKGKVILEEAGIYEMLLMKTLDELTLFKIEENQNDSTKYSAA